MSLLPLIEPGMLYNTFVVETALALVIVPEGLRIAAANLTPEGGAVRTSLAHPVQGHLF